ncbi:MAG: signal peptidase II [Crocinitomicaceae bacterium]
MTIRKKSWICFIIVFAILVLDQVVKIWVKTSFIPDQPVPLFGDWFRMLYVENQGMAFGTTLGSGWIPKLFLSLFRLVAICGIIYYIIKQIRAGVKTEYLIALSLILAGATGNLIDSALYDLIFQFDPTSRFNWLVSDGSYVFNQNGQPSLRHHGFLFGNVVDMFQFNLTWPSWVPYLGGGDVFSAIWNLADGAISLGVIMLLVRQRTYFGKKEKDIVVTDGSTTQESIENEEHSVS